MKIFCILSTSSLTGGSSLSFVQSCTEMTKWQDIDLIVSVPCKGPAYDHLVSLNIKTEICPTRFNIYPHSTLKNFLFAPIKLLRHLILNKQHEDILLNCVNKHKPDIIYTNVGVVNIGYNVAKKLSIPHIYHLREYQDLDFKMNIIPSRNSFLKKIKDSYTICITKGIQTHFKLIDNPKSRVIYNGVLQSQTPNHIHYRENYFLFVGRISEEKNPFSVIRAFNQFCKTNKNFKLLLAGNALSEGNLSLYKTYCEQNKLNDKVCFLGTRNDTNELMQKAYAVIVASNFEGFGRVTTEAMINGCLVIGRNTTGTKEQFDNGLILTGKEIGIRFNNDNELSERMQYAVNLSKEQYNEYTERARYTVEHLYTPKKCSDEIYNFFKYILEHK